MGTSGPAPNGAMGVANLIVGAPPGNERGIDHHPARPLSRADGNSPGNTGASIHNANGSTSQLLFFDTFSHEVIEELNLDLVQFPSPVIVDEVRIIPLGARVQANFAGGVRLGATNPTRFDLECFVNDLSTPGASTFEPLGVLHYDHQAKIHLRPSEYNERHGNINGRKIPTDGLVLRGFYNAITLAVYGTLSKSTAEQLAQAAQQQNVSGNMDHSQSTSALDNQVSCTSSAQMVENHVDSIAEREKSTPPDQSTLSQNCPPQEPHITSWAASGQANHDNLVAEWASSAAANLQQQNLLNTHPQNNAAATEPTSPMQYSEHQINVPHAASTAILAGTSSNAPQAQFDYTETTPSSVIQVAQNTSTMKNLTGDEWPPVNGGLGAMEQRKRPSTERSYDGPRINSNERHTLTTERSHRNRGSSGDRQPSRSPRSGVPEERNRVGREQDSSSSRGRSRTPASRSRSPHSAPGRSITPESRSGQTRINRTPTPINGYDSQTQACRQTNSSITAPSLLAAKADQSDSVPEGDILDDVSDISEGDIPDIQPEIEKQPDMPGGHQTLHIDTTPSDQANADNSDATLKQMVKGEDVEEISDEEAEWSDDGDCMIPHDFVLEDFEPESEWEEPIRIFDYFSPLTITQPPRYFTLRTFSEDSEKTLHPIDDSRKSYESSDETPDDNLASLAVKKIISTIDQLQSRTKKETKKSHKNMDIGSDWVESIEKLTAILSKGLKESYQLRESEVDIILQALRTGLSIEEASKQPKPAYKVRHIRSGLKLLYEIILHQQGKGIVSGSTFVSSEIVLEDGSIVRALLDIFKEELTANTIRLLVLQILDLLLNCREGLRWMLQKAKNTQNPSLCQNYSIPESSKVHMSATQTYFEELLQYTAGKKFSTRLRFAFASLVAKVSLHETLNKLSESALSLSQSGILDSSCNPAVIDDINDGLNQVHNCFLKAKSNIAQPKSTHFLPLTKIFDSQYEGKLKCPKIGDQKICDNNELSDPYPGIFFALQSYKTLKAILIFMSHPIISSNAMICAAIRALIYSIIHHPVGMVFLNGGAIFNDQDHETKEHFSAINEISKMLLRQSAIDEVTEQEDINHIERSSQNIGLDLVHTVYALNLLDQLYCLCHGTNNRKDLEQMDVLETIQTLHGMTFTISGKLAVTRLLTTGRNLDIILRFVRHSGELKDGDGSVTKKDMKRSAIRGYACELLLLVVRTSEDVSYLNHFALELLSVGRADETSKLHELISWTAPIESIKVDATFLSSLCEVVKSNCENVSPMSHELVTAVRAISCICLPNYRSTNQDSDNGCDILGKTFPSLPSLDNNIIYLYSGGLIEVYLTVLEKICGYHEQPHLHIATFVGHNGYVLLAVIKPIVQTLAVVLSHLIACQDNEFRNITPINVLLRTFTLCNVVPTSSSCYELSRVVCADIMQIMLSLTSTSFVQPTNTSLQIGRKDEVSVLQGSLSNGNIGKTLNSFSLNNTSIWQKMIIEVINYTLSAPHTYLAGLRIFSELLPLPLPIQTKMPHSEEENEKTENIRRLWSVHIYACERLVKEMVIKIGGVGSSCSTLGHLLRRVCVQLADLSPPISKIIAESLLDAFTMYHDLGSLSTFHNQPSESTQQIDETSVLPEKTHPCSTQTARILNLLMWLVSNGSVKSAFLEVTSKYHHTTESIEVNKYGKVVQTIVNVLYSFPNTADSTVVQEHQRNVSHTLAQEYIVGIIQMLLDPEISLVPIAQDAQDSVISDKHLANSLPPQDQYNIYLNGIIDYISTDEAELGFSQLAPVLRTMVMVTYHTNGLLKLKKILLEKSGVLCNVIKKIIGCFEESNKINNPDCYNVMTTISELLRIILGMALDANNTMSNEKDEMSGKKDRESQERIHLPEKRCVSISKEDVLKMFQWTKIEKKADSRESDDESTRYNPKSFAIASNLSCLKKEYRAGLIDHPLIKLETLVSQAADSDFNKKDPDVPSMEIDNSPPIEMETELIRDQFGILIQQLNDLYEHNVPELESVKAGGEVEEPDTTLQEAESLLAQFRQRTVFEVIRQENDGYTNNITEEMDTSRLEADGLNEDERLNACYWNVSTLEESNNGENETLLNTMDVEPTSNEQLIQVDLMDLASSISSDPKEPFDLMTHVRQVCDEKSLFETEASKLKKKPKKSLLEAKALANKKLISTFNAGGTFPGLPVGRGRGFHRTSGQRLDAFRSRPANTSRPPSLHVDDFLLLQMKGQQPTGPTGYNRQSVKAAQELFAEREAKSKGAMVGFRDVTKQPVYCDDNAPGASHGIDKGHLNMGWNSRGRADFGPKGTRGFMRGQGRGGSFSSFSSGRGSWNSYHRSDYGRNSGVSGGSHFSGMNQERRFTMNDNGGSSNPGTNRRSTERSSKDRSSGGMKAGTRR